MTFKSSAVALALGSALALSGGTALAQSRAVARGGSHGGSGSRGGSWGHGGSGGSGGYGYGHAVPRGSGYPGGGYSGGGAAYRHPRAGTGTGYYYGSGYGHGYSGHGYYGHGYYPYHGAYYPYYGAYPYYGYGYGYSYPYVGLSFNWSSGSYYSAPYAVPAESAGYAAPSTVTYETPSRDPEDRDSGWLRIEVRPEDTSVYVDDQFRGTGRETRGLALSGHHTIEFVRPGFVTERHEVDIATGERSDLFVEMRR